MENLRIWLKNVDALCANVLHEPTSGLHKMNLAQALRRGERVMAATGRVQKAGRSIAHLAEIVDTVKHQIWDSQYALSDHYLKALRGLIEGLRREVLTLIAEIEGMKKDPATSLSTDQALASRDHAERIASAPTVACRRHKSLWSGFLGSFGKSATKK